MLGYKDIANDSQGASYSGSTLVKGNPNFVNYTAKSGTMHIAALAFRKAERLSNIGLPNGLLSIGDAAFSYCKSLKHITIPSTVESIGVSAFSNSALEEVVFLGVPDSLEPSIFAGCESLKQIVEPQGRRQYFQNILADQCQIIKETSDGDSRIETNVLNKPSIKAQKNDNSQISNQNMDTKEILEALKEDYSIRRSLKRKNLVVQTEIEEEIKSLESSYIAMQKSVIQDYANNLFDCLECDVCITITKKANEDIKIESETITQTEPIQEDDNQVSDAPAPSESVGFTVTFPNGKIIQSNNAKNTMIAALKAIGLEKVSHFTKRLFKGYPLVGKKRRDNTDKWQAYVDGWYIYTNMNNSTKKRVLEMISKEFGLNLIVKDETDTDIPYIEEIIEDVPQKRQLYSFNGSVPTNKRRIVWQVVKQYLGKFPTTTYDELEKVFPQNLQGSYGVFAKMSWIEQQTNNGHDHINRYFTNDDELLTTSDGILIAVSTQWGDNFSRFIKNISKIGWSIKAV